MKEEKIDISKLIEQYRYWVGGGLLALAVVSSSYLVYAKNQQGFDAQTKISMLEERIASLEKKQTTDPASLKDQTQATAPASQPAQDQSVPAAIESSTPPKAEAPSSPAPQVKGTATKIPNTSGPINLNTATLSQLDSLPGIGPTYAQRIIDYRQSHGGFKTIEEIQNVKGIGPKTFEKFKDKITVN